MRASRLVSVLLLLQNRGRMTAEELAAELEVSVRTVYRDIDSLSAAGVPVYAEHGRSGGYRLVGGYRTRLTGLTEQEAAALPLTGLPEAAAELGLGTVLAAARLKLTAALPRDLRDRAAMVADRFHLDVPGFFRGVESLPSLSALAEAVWEERQIRVRYRKWAQQEVDRLLEPLGLVLKAGNWYLVARAVPRRTPSERDRTDVGEPVNAYRVSRILSLSVTGERFARPAGFDLAEYWRGWSERFERTLYPNVAVVRMSPLAREVAGAYLGAVGGRAVRETAGEPDADGWRRVELPVEAGRPGLGELLRFGPDLEVLEPEELRREVAEAIRKMGARYV